MKQHAEDTISDEAFAKGSERWPEDTPQTKEAYLIRQIFDGTFSKRASANKIYSMVPL